MRKLVVSAILLLSSSVAATAQVTNSCDLLLQHGINDITKYKSARHAIAYKWHKYCGVDFASMSDSRVSRASVSVFGYGSGSGGYNSSEQRTKLQKWCDENRAFAEQRSDLYEESQTLSTAALSSWEQCIAMARKDILIRFLPTGDHSRFVHFEIDSTHDGSLKYFGVTSKNFTCIEQMVRPDTGETEDTDSQPNIANSNIQIDCERNVPNVSEQDGIGKVEFDEAYLSVNTSGPAFSIAFPRVVETYYVTPPSAVLPFNSDRCPEGWREFEPAAGRFIVGTGTSFALGEQGGRLDIPSDGNHRHSRGEQIAHNFGDDNADNNFVTAHAGAHNHGGQNVPPYIALRYCQRPG
ncbi:hypothetical protein [uncultured Roseibium sp.]|uniref:hypothetical protein n=1 Tax=uncultured Roseibium sp. TaxID=1936171 RepID=UPI00262A9E1D|nr:hypothetical protein [uncultured Roseibium sp.]